MIGPAPLFPPWGMSFGFPKGAASPLNLQHGYYRYILLQMFFGRLDQARSTAKRLRSVSEQKVR